jgi:hypothetical protein
MKRHSRTKIKLAWAEDAPFTVRVNRTIPKARRADDSIIQFFIPRDEEPWRVPSFLV